MKVVVVDQVLEVDLAEVDLDAEEDAGVLVEDVEASGAEGEQCLTAVTVKEARVPVFVNLGRTVHSLRIGVIPNALALADAQEVKAELRRVLGADLALFVEQELLLAIQKLNATSPELVDIITENTKEGSCVDGKYGETEGP